MKTRNSRKIKIVFAVLTGLALISGFCDGNPSFAKVYAVEPLLVPQPSFAGMTFHVYKPYNLPPNWYATFDGYPVTKNKDGVWVYGTHTDVGLIPTRFIVGSVVPSMAGITPHPEPIQVSSATRLSHPPVLPEMPMPVMPAAPIAPEGVQQPFAAHQPSIIHVPQGPAVSTYMPAWILDSKFMALGKWKTSVDRMGVLHKPGIPVAWLGDSPKVIYAWNGRSWTQMLTREGERPVNTLMSNMYRLTKQTHRSGFVLYEADMTLLAQQAANWGYYWMGEIFPGWTEDR